MMTERRNNGNRVFDYQISRLIDIRSAQLCMQILRWPDRTGQKAMGNGEKELHSKHCRAVSGLTFGS